MTDKTAHLSWIFKIAIIVSIMAVFLFCGEFVRIELMLKEQTTRMNQLEDKLTSTLNIKSRNAIYSPDEHRSSKDIYERNSKETSQRILKRKIRQTLMRTNQTKAKQKNTLRQIIQQELGKAISTLKAAKYWIAIPGPTGPPGKQGEKGDKGQKGNRGQKGRRGKRGPRGFKGDPGKNGAPGPRGMPGLKGDPGRSLSSPSVLISPPRLIVNEGQSAILRCSASGYPKPVIVWSKRNGLLSNNKSITDNGGRLEIKHVTLDDAGIYQCKASNILGKVHNTANLVVNFRPRLTFKTDPIYSKIGDNITLPKCHANGHPKPNVTWSKAFGSLPYDRTFIKDGQLTVLGSKKNDAGTYVCKAENRLGSDELAIVVNIIQLPHRQPKLLFCGIVLQRTIVLAEH